MYNGAGIYKNNDIDNLIPPDTTAENPLVNESGLQDTIDDAMSAISTGYIPKGNASVSAINALTERQNGDMYVVSDSGTISDGNVTVNAGESVAWDASSSVWYKVNNYALRQFGTDNVKNLSTAITAFRTGDVIPVDGPSGPAKMSKDDLLRETAQNTLAGNAAPEFDPTRDEAHKYLAGESVVYNGQIYTFAVDHYGPWDLKDASVTPIASVLSRRISPIMIFGTQMTNGEFYVDYETGAAVPYDGFKLSDYISVENCAGIEINANPGTHAGVAFYSNKDVSSFVSGTKNYNYVAESNTGYFIEKPKNAKYMRIGVSPNDAFVRLYNIVSDFVTKGSISRKQLETFYGKQMTNGEYYVDYQTGAAVSYAGFKLSDYISVENAISLLVNANPGTNAGLAFYSDKSESSFIVGTKNYNQGRGYVVNIPDGAKYFRIGVRNDFDYADIEYNVCKLIDDETCTSSEDTFVYGSHMDNGEYYVDYQTGEAVAFSGFKLSDYISVENAISLVVNANIGTHAGLAFYSDKSESSFIVGTKNYNQGRGYVVNIPDGAKYVRIGVSFDFNYLKIRYYTDKCVSHDEYNNAMEKAVDQYIYGKQMDNGEYYVDYQTGEAVAFSGFKLSDYISVENAVSLVVNANVGTHAGLAFYSDKNESSFISGSKGYSYVSGGSGNLVPIPFGAKYLRIGTSFDDAYVKIVYKIQRILVVENDLNAVKNNIENIEAELDDLSKNANSLNVFSRINAEEKKKINVLFVGNSWSRDAAVYLPQLLSDKGIDANVGVLYHGGASLQSQVAAIGTNYYSFDFNDGNGWITSESKSLEYGCKYENWDVVVFLQLSSLSGYRNKDSITSYLGILLNQVESYLVDSSVFDGSIVFGWQSVPSYPDGFTPASYSTSDDMADDILKMSKFIYDNYEQISFIIPETTAIQKARKTTLNQYGGYDHSTHSSGPTSGLMYLDTSLHLCEGIGRQIAGSVFLESVCGVSCLCNKARFTEASSLEPHGPAVGSNDANSIIAQKCVKQAIKQPLIID